MYLKKGEKYMYCRLTVSSSHKYVYYVYLLHACTVQKNCTLMTTKLLYKTYDYITVPTVLLQYCTLMTSKLEYSKTYDWINVPTIKLYLDNVKARVQ